MNKELSSVLIQAKTQEEIEYCEKHNVQFRRLENGITIVGISCQKDSAAWAKIGWEFLEGAYGNQSGAVHFLEHFINKRTRTIAERNGLNLRATTSQIEIVEEVAGITNPKARDYGTWTVLGSIREALESPSRTVENFEDAVETEKKVIRAEIRRQDADHNFQVGNHFRNVLYSSQNPWHNNPTVTGSEDDISRIDVKTLKKVETNVFIPHNLVVSFYAEGDPKIGKILAQELEELFRDFPRQERVGNEIDKKLLEQINPNFKPGSEYRRDTNLKNGIVTTEFAWVLDNKFPSISYFALAELRHALSTELFMHSRKMGWGYYTEANLIRPSDNLGIVVLRIDSRKDEQVDYLTGIKKVLSSVTEISDSLCDLEAKRQKATPILLIDRLSWIISGFKDHKAIIDIDKLRPIRTSVEASDINKLADQLLSVDPAVIITGDLE